MVTLQKKKKISDAVIITTIHLYYINGCQPNKNQLVLTRCRSGVHSKFNLVMMKD